MSRKLDRDRVARCVKARRGELRYSQRELAERAGVDVKTINSLESSSRWPQATKRAAIEDALNWRSGSLLRIAEGGEPGDLMADAEAATVQASAHGATVTTIEGRASARLEEISQAVGLNDQPPFPNPTSKTQQAANQMWQAFRLLVEDDPSDATVRGVIRRGAVDLEELQEREKLRGSG